MREDQKIKWKNIEHLSFANQNETKNQSISMQEFQCIVLKKTNLWAIYLYTDLLSVWKS